MTRARGQLDSSGLLTFCDDFEHHGIGCTCAAPRWTIREASPDDAFAMETFGQLLGNMLAGAFRQEPGPPYVHTFVPPEPIGYTEDGDPVYPEPGPALTLTEKPLTEVVDPDRPAWLVKAAMACDARQRAIVEARRMPVEQRPLSIAVGEPLDGDEYRWKPGAGEP